MAAAKHKVKETKKKTWVDKLKGSSIFILLVILLFITDIVAFIFWLSNLLSGQPGYEGLGLVTNEPFYIFVGIGAVLGVFFGLATLTQRRVHGS